MSGKGYSSNNSHGHGHTNGTSVAMSDLRQYRFQKKPSLSGPASASGGSSDSSNLPPRPSGAAGSTWHSFSSSSTTSNNFSNGPNTSNQGNSKLITYKRIRPMDSESENESSPVKKIPATPEKPLIVDNATKDRRLHNMVGMFPDISALIVKNTLMKHNWSEERARDELLDFDPEQREINKSVRPLAFANGYLAKEALKTYSRIKNCGPIKRTKRKGSDDGSDSEYEKKKGDRVFDSDDDSESEITNDMFGDRKKVYEFLNTARMSELQQLQGCSLKKADEIIACRPFQGWADMVEKFQKSKNLNTDILNSTQEVLRIRNNVAKLMKKCSSLALQMESAVALGAGLLKQPSILEPSLQLASYQVIGLNWLAVLHNQKVNGILADEMGLGKTVQVIAFLAYLKETNQTLGPHLIVVPSSTLENWNVEFARWCPSMRIAIYYGNPDERKMMRISWGRGGLNDIDVILTTYNLVCSCPEERKMFRVTPMHYVVFDEAHMLKNMATQRYDNLIKIRATNRLLLTGTPLQNNLMELMSLLCFIMPHLFANNAEDIKSVFRKNVKVAGKKTTDKIDDDDDDIPPFEQSQINQAKRIMKPFVLRRLKRDVLKDLPTKTDLTIKCPMVPSQQKQYDALIDSFRSKERMIEESSGMTMLMDLRKLSNHPLLMRYYYDENKLRKLSKYLSKDTFYKENNAQYIYEDLLFMSDFQIHQLTQQYKSVIGMKVPEDLILKSGKFEKLDEMLPKLKQEGHRVLIFSQFTMMLDILEPYLKLRGYQYLRLDGSTAVTVRQELIDQYNQESDLFIFLLSTKAGGLGINLTAADTVIIHDIDFNPYNDKQAEDRCHRMGQKRPVTIHRFVSAGTIEEGIYQVAQEKLNLERDITNTNENEPQEMRNVVRLLHSALGLSPTK